jgi:iron(III) transport system substrate-binding protein
MPSGTMRTIYSAMVYQQFATGGSPQPGYDFLKALDANTVAYTATPDDMYTQLDQGTGVVTVWNLQDALIQPLKNNRPWSYVMPTSGAPVLLDAVGIINNKAQNQAAKDFEDFLMEPTMQAKLAKDYYQVPAMEIPAADKPAWLTSLKLKEMPIDWKVLGANQDKWMTYWVDNIKGKGKA